ncbi:beta-ketoacyl-[acyl-carrier-protein] synthase family protein [Serratia rubidaea]|uniref:beta-ketoacyl-[acyl-carrier-protein] synthase family protein n=1 Tax=Serratia rubidaea TaxID=61652 RepID=UPI002DB9FA12|nr:beta-ketoacyl-[acyl-carrier-protein] synthase family protein [Serratia rubidaea]MEB7586985.1 beta-ketoacyl-[acyl-carrier-protein] synthase family protein [Serratia rubidaea]
MAGQLHRVVITGYGGICPLGENTAEIWQGVLDKQLGYDIWDKPGRNISAKVFGKIKFPLELSKFTKRILKNTPRFAELGLIATDEAITMAFGEAQNISEHYSPLDCGVIFGTGWAGYDLSTSNSIAYDDPEIASATPHSCFNSMPSIATSVISVNWQLRGYQNTPIAACATGNIAIGDAYEIVKSGKAKMMIAGGGESLMHPFTVWSVDVLGALSKEQTDLVKACCPFSLDRSGFVLSEGAAVVCLERLEDALARNATIYGEIIGYANHSDAYINLTAPAPDLLGRVTTIEKAMEYAEVTHDDIDYINAHGTSTPMNDHNETLVLKEVFGEQAYDIPVSSTKSYTGHLIAAAGGMETIFCLKGMENQVIPATINLNNPDPKCDLDYVPNEHRYAQNLNHVININYGFGGANSCLVLKRFAQ